MSFDGIFLHHMTKELTEQLIGGRIQKVNQVFSHEVVLQVRSNQKSHKLLLSAHPTFGRIQLTNTVFENAKTPSTFTMILRKYLSGAFIENIYQVNNDRQIIFEISSKNEIGDSMKIALISEIMGKHSHIILIDRQSNKILESIKHVGFSQNKYRTILPGATYIAPPDDGKANPFTASDEKLFDILQTKAKLQDHFQGIGRDSASSLSTLSLSDFKATLTTPLPSIYPNDTFSAIQLSDTFEQFDTLSDMLDAYYRNKAERDRVRQVAGEVIRKVSGELDKNRKKLKKQLRELQATDNAEMFRQKGELLTTFLHEVPNNKPEITLDNYYTNEPLTISLNPALTPNQNAQKYFHKYAKLKQAVKFLDLQLATTRQTINYLESVENALKQATVTEISDIREELIQTGFIKQKHRTNKKHKLLPPEKYRASDGTIILVGKNNLQNEQVSFKLSRKGDLWFHAKDIPGSHVIITGNPTPSDETITEAAELAAYFSKSRLSNLVQVDMIDVKKLHKPTGTPPGFVTYVGQQTLRVTAEEHKIQEMKANV
ncbi:fibronectin/fibrinogen-binding protein [Lactococcus piscium]|uniref:Rqc2 family fibronectin-binding protein n=1 Tax=Pseudolactococcus carnosus TaxID=2749961 RepID=UPI0015DD41B1|nr:NFACT family protein [Lactococcus carnosus]MCJ1972383.1 fibronectin/fibrinogen-binding protein [Lactococcus carnosus]MCJ1974543.1 fibronectin/fibrinogen-binding protein [Lactococcus carnosus]MCJ1981052.1 fibronectin/fibrinogen-binding protein [Lactococcus carnosus]MCJ1984640.1 fibronectin/fibrinogen-binding protein [Lactococcus carnosus]MCJ1987160.1 fibronectin/fibrinogen-binding protein [Lactococcus carnosus]